LHSSKEEARATARWSHTSIGKYIKTYFSSVPDTVKNLSDLTTKQLEEIQGYL
jgi:hypothetical protein